MSCVVDSGSAGFEGKGGGEREAGIETVQRKIDGRKGGVLGLLDRYGWMG